MLIVFRFNESGRVCSGEYLLYTKDTKDKDFYMQNIGEFIYVYSMIWAAILALITSCFICNVFSMYYFNVALEKKCEDEF